MLLALTASLAGVTTVTGRAAGPPRGLSTNGRVIWNLDALLKETFGTRTVCYRFKTSVIFSVPRNHDCGFPTVARAYEYTFANARDSAYHLARLAHYPDMGALNAALQIGGRYIICGPRSVLGVGGDEGPGAFAWCVPTG